jgi:hypothetical protein
MSSESSKRLAVIEREVLRKILGAIKLIIYGENDVIMN